MVISLAILYILNIQTKYNILSKEQFYINLYKPILIINTYVSSSLVFKHT